MILLQGHYCTLRFLVIMHGTPLKVWHRRIQGTTVENQPEVKASDALGRVYTIHVTNLKCFCLRMLLHHVRGPTSFTELKIVNGQKCQTYREACEARRLLENDNH
ncbi:ATP-dependent DNA helicase [Trichonephila clavipes]|nr:ATP-dependent DNA helicase [Trichonephila clavipes]